MDTPEEIGGIVLTLELLIFLGVVAFLGATGLWGIFKTRQSDLDDINTNMEDAIDKLAAALRKEINANAAADVKPKDELHKRLNEVNQDLKGLEREGKRDYQKLVDLLILGGKKDG